jgi:dUTP pyrophosphatase
MKMNPIQFKLLSADAKCPTRNEGDAGYDLVSPISVVVPARQTKLVKTNIAVKFPDVGLLDLYGRIAPRSGLALKNSIGIGGGVVDKSYTGDIGVVIFNHGDEDFQILKGDRIAQLIIEIIATPKIQVSDFETSEIESERGGRGFGSSGR